MKKAGRHDAESRLHLKEKDVILYVKTYRLFGGIMGNKEQYILAHDLGTSGNKATLYGVDGTLRCSVV